jgi:hypothetical protein
VRVPYMPVPVQQPVPSLGGIRVRYRPIVAVRLTGPADTKIRDGLLDTGSDDTVFSASLASLLGVDLRGAQERRVGLAGRPRPIRCRYAMVRLRITDRRQETYEWTAMVGFVAASLHYSLLGHAGFLQFFRAEFDGESRDVTLIPKPSFPGRLL